MMLYGSLTFRWFLLLIGLGFVPLSGTALESFEGATVPAGWEAAGDALGITTERYKDGSNSLCWRWQTESQLTFRDPAAFSGITLKPDRNIPGG